MKSGIYQIRNLANGKVYVGSAESFRRRWNEHRRDLRQNQHHSPHLQRAWDKYNEDNFFFGILQECEFEDLLFYEQLWMNCLHSHDPQFGYNICKVAGSPMKDRKHSEETKRKMCDRRPSEETRKKMSKAHCGKKHSEESRKKMCGRIFSEETRIKISEALCGRVLSEGHKKKMSEANLGKKLTDETKRKMSEAHRDVAGEHNAAAKLTQEDVQKIREKYLSGTYTQKELSEEYGVSRSNIGFIVRNKTWCDQDLSV